MKIICYKDLNLIGNQKENQINFIVKSNIVIKTSDVFKNVKKFEINLFCKTFNLANKA